MLREVPAQEARQEARRVSGGRAVGLVFEIEPGLDVTLGEFLQSLLERGGNGIALIGGHLDEDPLGVALRIDQIVTL